jgi:tripartite-type tricarboxylate transporter receptor subunit TctC
MTRSADPTLVSEKLYAGARGFRFNGIPLVFAGLAGVLALAAFDASPQSTYPTRPIRIVVPFPPGGSTDFLARGIGQKLMEAWGQQVVIDNRSGAGGIVGTEIVANAAPDGYNLLMNAIGHAANPSLYKKLPYDTQRDFSPIILVADVPTILVVPSQLNVSTVKELIALAKTKPGQLNCAAGGVGASSHLAAELFRSQAKIDWQNIQYKGGGPAFLELVGGNVDVMFSPVSSSIQQVKAGRIKVLGVTSPKRVPLIPDVPTIAEAGLPGYEFQAWYGLVAPARVPKEIVVKLHREINDLLKNPQFRDTMIARGAIPIGGSSEEFGEFMRKEVKKYAAVAKEAGIRPE